MALYLGFDASTQSLTATLIEVTSMARRVVFEDVLVFDEALPQYGTRHGVLARDGGSVTAPPLMWAEALDLMAGRLRDAGLDLRAVQAISGSGQQHGSVYLADDWLRRLPSLDPSRSLGQQLASVFSRAESPVWLDCSTTRECAAIEEAIGGGSALAKLTGSRAYERFTGAQIRKFSKEDATAYSRTARIHLVSSFMASLLCGQDAPLEPADASGMNLMDLAAARWAPRALAATAPDLLRRLPPIRDSWSIAGILAPYWQQRFGFGAAKVVTWTGDNPSSLIGLGLVSAGALGISLGTSDTVFAPTPNPAADPHGAGHVFGSPAGGYMALTCFANGSLARERIKNEYQLDWSGFSRALRDTPPGNDGALMVPWYAPEITPTIDLPGPHRHGLEASDVTRNVRAVVEGQAMSMRLYSRWFAPTVTAIRATGGAAVNGDILQVIADVFDAPVVRIAPPNAAALGAALRAFHADRLASGEPLGWSEVVAGFTDPVDGAAAQPRRAGTATYAGLLPRYAALVESVIAKRFD